MAHLRKTLLVAACMSVLVLGLQPLAAQSGKGSGTSSTGSNTTGNSSRSSGVQATPDTDFTRNIILSGNVVMSDGSPLPEPVAIERVCGASTVRMGYTDAKGYFSLQLAGPPVLQDASENGRDAYTRSAVGGPSSTSFGVSSSRAGNYALASLMGCDLTAVLSGFQSSSVMIRVQDPIQPTDVGTIVLMRSEKQGSMVSATSLRAPKDARKAYERASADMRKQKPEKAQAELQKAVKLYPQYAAAWNDLGWLYARQNRLDDARGAFAQARSADDGFVPPYVGLAALAARESNWNEVLQFSGRATELDGVDFPSAHYYSALASFQLGQLGNAEKSARMAERLDTRHSLPQVILLLGGILGTKQNYAQAAEELKLYLKVAPTAANAQKVQQRLVEFERLSTSADPSAPKDLLFPVAVAAAADLHVEALTNWEEPAGMGANFNPPAAALAKNWAPPDIDQVVPPVSPGVSCPAHNVVSEASLRAKELMDNLQQFSATEQIEYVKVDKAGNPDRAASASFKYVAEIRETRTGWLTVDEYRDGNSSNGASLGNVAVTGIAAHALLFHPSLIEDLSVTCEGLGNLQGRPAWQLRFAQRPDRPPRFRYYITAKGSFPVEMKGRAWVAVDTYQVMRMETDLAKPIDEIRLRKDHIIIDYQPVEFPKRKVQLWLPQTTDLYMDFAGHRSRRRHSFSDFELFWVDVAEKTRDPEVR